MHITHHESYRAYSNTLQERTEEIVNNDDRTVTTTFEETINLPTYLVAWALASNYKSLSGSSESGISVNVLYDKIPDLANFSLTVALKSLDFLEHSLKVLLPIHKIDFFPVPNFSTEGMENMGLITISSSALLIPHNDTIPSLQYTALLISHELAHHWFGNLITTTRWDSLYS